MSDKIPERRYKLTVEFQADDAEALNRIIDHFSYYWSTVASDYMPNNGHSAGYDSSFSHTLRIDESVTGDSYRDELMSRLGLTDMKREVKLKGSPNDSGQKDELKGSPDG